MPNTLTQISIKLFTHSLGRLIDPNWTGLDLFYLLKEPVAKDQLLFKSNKEGLLFHLGLWFFDEYILGECEGASGPCPDIKDEYLGWYIEDLLDLLEFHGADKTQKIFQQGLELVEQIDQMYESDEITYFDFLESKIGQKKIQKIVNHLRKEYSEVLHSIKTYYAEEFAERVFHDRNLCEFISDMIILIGYPGYDDEAGEPETKIPRITFPEWVKRAVHARDRGKCGHCGQSITMELEAAGHVDHIIPLSAGGCNDLVNLQLLCKDCNLKKSAHKWPAKSSIPKYLQRKIK